MRDLVCFSHLRWTSLHQRPQHLMSRAARERRVWFVEEPVPGPRPRMRREVTPEGIHVCVPEVPAGLGPDGAETVAGGLMAALARAEGIRDATAWIYTPMLLPLADVLAPRVVVYDCMDELTSFRDAPPELTYRERTLFSRADLVFTSGRSLWEAKRSRHGDVHLFPSSVEAAHFAAARTRRSAPRALAGLPRPRVGWAGSIDERVDLGLLAEAAALRPAWSWVLLGPVAGVDVTPLTRLDNVRVIGPRPYRELPAWLAHFDVGMMPFAQNEATRFISPTKTPEYLAAGLPVVSTPVADVAREWGDRGLVHIAEGAAAFVDACERALAERDDPARLARVDRALSRTSWDDTWARMDRLLEGAEARVLVGSAK